MSRPLKLGSQPGQPGARLFSLDDAGREKILETAEKLAKDDRIETSKLLRALGLDESHTYTASVVTDAMHAGGWKIRRLLLGGKQQRTWVRARDPEDVPDRIILDGSLEMPPGLADCGRHEDWLLETDYTPIKQPKSYNQDSFSRRDMEIILHLARKLDRELGLFPVSEILDRIHLSGRGWEMKIARLLRGAGFIRTVGYYADTESVRQLWCIPKKVAGIESGD